MTIKKTKRSAEFIATFESGYSTDLVYCLPEAFKDALDIKYTPRTKTDKKTKQTVTTYHWVQGNNYRFYRGDTFHSHRDAYSTPAIARHWVSIQVIRVFANNGQQIDEQRIAQSVDDLFLELKILQPDNSQTTQICTAQQLMHHLKTGKWQTPT